VLVIVVLGAAYALINRTNGKILTSGVERRFLLYVPESYNPDQPTSLIISIHGFSSWPQDQMRISQWNDLADQYGIIVVYPSGTGFPKRWNLFTNSSTTRSNADIQFISDLIDLLQKEYNIDSRRIYVNGLSNGGGMTTVLGCKLSDRIAAIGSVSGAYIFPLDTCTPERFVPAIIFHGTADPIVPYSGGASDSFDLPFPNIPEWVNQLAIRNGCSPTPVVILDQEAASGVEYRECSANASVVFYTLFGAGHTWPGGKPYPVWLTGSTSQAISATELMWQFFELHPLPLPIMP
jgi:polyhydroxybutyrate depolymerase